MKKSILFILISLSLTPIELVAQTWNLVGSANFSVGFAAYTSIAIDSANTPYVAFQDYANGNKATVMKYNGSSWVVVGSSGFSAGAIGNISLAIDRSGTPYVAFPDSSNSEKTTVMKYNGISWAYVGIAGFSAGIANSTSIAIDSSGTPYVVYSDFGTGAPHGGATVMKYDGSSWIDVGIAKFSAAQAAWPSIAIDHSGTPYVCYQDNSFTFLNATVMKYNGSSWVDVGAPGFSATTIQLSSIVIDGSGTPYVGFQGVVMKYNGTNWVNVGSGFAPDVYISLALDNIGTPYYAYGANVAKYNGTTWVNVGNANFSEGVANYASIAIGRNNTPYVAYANVDTVFYTYGRATVMKLDTIPSLIAGIDSVCTGAIITLSDTTSGGSWSSSNSSVATIGSGTGIVTGVASGSVTLSYTVAGCSAIFHVTVNHCTAGISAVATPTEGITIYPNPTQNNIMVSSTSEINDIVICNLIGQKVYSSSYNTNNAIVSLEQLPVGIYVVKVNGDKVYKVVKR